MERKQINVHYQRKLVKQSDNNIPDGNKYSNVFDTLEKPTRYLNFDNTLRCTSRESKNVQSKSLSIHKLKRAVLQDEERYEADKVQYNEFYLSKSISEESDLDRTNKNDTSRMYVKEPKVDVSKKNNLDIIKLSGLTNNNRENNGIFINSRAHAHKDTEMYYDSISTGGVRSESSCFESAMSSNDTMTHFSASQNSDVVMSVVNPAATKFGIDYVSITSENIPSVLNEISDHKNIRANKIDNMDQSLKKSSGITIPQFPKNSKNVSIKKLIDLTKMRDPISRNFKSAKKFVIRRNHPYVSATGKPITKEIILNSRTKGINLKELYLSQRGKAASCVSVNKDKNDLPVEYGSELIQPKKILRVPLCSERSVQPNVGENSKESNQPTCIKKIKCCINEKPNFAKDSNTVDVTMKRSQNSNNISPLIFKGVLSVRLPSNQIHSTDQSKRKFTAYISKMVDH